MPGLSVFIADDHVVVRRGLRALLENEPDLTVVGEAGDGHEVVSAVERLKPDVLVLDLSMPGIGGLEVLKALSQRDLPTRVVVLSMHAKDAFVAEALTLGALAYVVKDASASDVLRAVRHVASGQRYLSPPLSEAAIDAYRQRTRPEAPDPYEALTVRERQVLALAAQGRTNQQIAGELTISRRTAETHRANLMRKLGLKGQQELIRYAFQRGLVDF